MKPTGGVGLQGTRQSFSAQPRAVMDETMVLGLASTLASSFSAQPRAVMDETEVLQRAEQGEPILSVLNPEP